MRHADRPDLGFTRPLDQESRDHLRLRRQWVIQPRHEASERPWPRIDLGRSLVLHHHRELAVQQAVLDDRRVVVLGVAIATASQRRPLDVRLRHVVEGRETVTTLLHELCGTYVLIYSTPDHVAVYGDPAGMMSVFYGRERVSSTPTLIGPLVRDRALDAEYPFRGDNDWYPGSLTPYEGVRALLPNHALDAASHTIARFWPTEEPKRLDPYTGRRHLAELLQDLVEAAVARGPVLCSVTGGRDSRVNVAALRRVTKDVKFFTVRGPGIAPCDVKAPAELARRFGLDHVFVDNAEPEPWLLELYDEMTAGLSISGRRDVVGAVSTLAGDYTHLNGNLGGLAKSYFWHRPNPRKVKRKALSKEFVTRSPRVEAALDEWLATVPDLPAPTVYNLMFLEQRAGRWMSVGETASSLFYDSFTPLCSREVFEIICGMPAKAQYGGSLLTELVRDLWPELLEVPYCRARRNWSTYVPRPIKSGVKEALARR